MTIRVESSTVAVSTMLTIVGTESLSAGVLSDGGVAVPPTQETISVPKMI